MSSEAITATPPTATPTARSPDAPVPAPPGHWHAAHVLLLLLLLLLSFFLGSFLAANSDIWMQLATGRALARGTYTFGVDPFSWASAGRYWVNHSWGFAWVAYSLYTNFGPQALSAVNALLVVAMTVLMLRTRPANTSPLISLEVIGLALVAASVRFSLQPHMVSMTLLAGLLYLLFRAGALGGGDAPSVRALWSMPALFAVWANFDVYFVMGLLVLGLSVLGVSLTARDARTICVRRFGMVFLLSIGACCLNPHVWRVFTAPADLGALLSWLGLPDAWTGGGAALRLAEQHFGAGSLRSPLSSRYLMTFEAASLTFFPLWLIHAGSLALLRVRSSSAGERMPLARVCLGVVFAVLALLQIRLIPWFAIVCGPLTALNLLDAARLKQPNASPARASFLSRADLVLALVIFALANVLAWPGWLHARSFDADSPRRVAWGIRENESLRKLALAIQDEEPGNIFNLNLEIAPYCAWHAPRSRTYLDARFALFAGDFRTLDEIDAALSDRQSTKWQPFFAKHDVRYLALTNHHIAASFFQRTNTPMIPPRDADALRTMQRLWHDPRSWAEVYNDGRSALFAWHASHDNERQPLEEKWSQRAFGKDTKLHLNSNLPVRGFGDLYFQRMKPIQQHSTEAAMLAHHYFYLRENWKIPYRFAHIVLDRTIPLAGGGIGSGLSGLQLPLMFTRMGRNVEDSESFDLPEIPILMIRSARALAPRFPKVHPPQLGPNPNRYLALGYQLQSRNIEDAWTSKLSPLPTKVHFLRNLQIAAAARRAILDAPEDDDEAHELLALLMTDLQFLDLQLEHRKKIVEHRLTMEKKMAPLLGDDSLFKRYTAETKGRANQLKQLESVYLEHKRLFDARMKEGNFEEPVASFRRFQLALLPQDLPGRDGKKFRGTLGLATEGLKGLEKAWPQLPADIDPRERYILFRQLLQLYLQLGMADEAELFLRKNFDHAEQYVKAGNPEILFLLAGLKAAQGDYEHADRVLADLTQIFARKNIVERMVLPLGWSFARQTELAVGGGMAPSAFWMATQIHSAAEPASTLNFGSEYLVLRGLLALEAGENDAALKHFQDALAQEARGIPFPERIIAEKYIALLKKHRD